MNKYVVSFVNFHDNELLMKIVEAESYLEAAIRYCVDNTGWTDLESYTEFNVLQNDLFDGDCLINVIFIGESAAQIEDKDGTFARYFYSIN